MLNKSLFLASIIVLHGSVQGMHLHLKKTEDALSQLNILKQGLAERDKKKIEQSQVSKLQENAQTTDVPVTTLKLEDPVLEVLFSPNDNTLLASRSFNTSALHGIITIWNTATKKATSTIQQAFLWTDELSFNRAGTHLAGINIRGDTTVKFYDIQNQQEITMLEEHKDAINSTRFDPTQNLLASSSDDKTIKTWDISTRQLIATLRGHKASVYIARFSPTGELASWSEDKTIKRWDPRKPDAIATFEGNNSLGSVSYSQDGLLLAYGVSLDEDGHGKIKVWDLRMPNEEVTTLNQVSADASYPASFSPKDKKIAYGFLDGKIKLWNVDNPREMEEFELPDNYGPTPDFCFSPNGEYCAGCSHNAQQNNAEANAIRYWKADTQEVVATLVGHEYALSSINFSPDGKTLASGSFDRTIKLWQVQKEEEEATKEQPESSNGGYWCSLQ